MTQQASFPARDAFARRKSASCGACPRHLSADPGEAIGLLTGFDAAHNFERMQIDYGDVVVRRAGHVGARPVGLHKNPGSALSYIYMLHLFSGDSIENGDIRLLKARNKRQLAIRGKLQPIRFLDVGGQSVDDLLARHINDGDRSIVGVGDPDLLAIRRYVKSLRATTDGNQGFVPVSTRRPRSHTTAHLSMRLTLAELTFVVTIWLRSGET